MSVAADNNNLCKGLILINTAGKVVSVHTPVSHGHPWSTRVSALTAPVLLATVPRCPCR
jgi:hypothetical protein